MKQSEIKLDFRQRHVMAILNVTPDSFYGKSRTFSESEIKCRITQVISQGATIIDVGGYSSRPAAEDVSIEEEWSRVDRALTVLRMIAPSITVSIDTFRSEVAERALEKFGSLIINDISAGEIDPRLIAVAAKYDVPYIAMHMRGTPQTMQQYTSYNNVVEEVTTYFKAKIKQLTQRGINKIIIDPGFGFAKSLDQNYELMARLSDLTALGYPVLVGISRKSMIYNLLGVAATEALSGTIALNWEALRKGATILRVHDVREAVDTIKIFNKLQKV